MDYSEKWGVDVDEAVRLALMDLKLSRDEVEVTVLEQPSKGFFGIGSKLAKVRVEKKKEEPEKKEETPMKSAEIVVSEKKETAEVSEAQPREKREEKRSRKNRGKNRNDNREGRDHKREREERNAHVEKSLSIDAVDKDKLEEVEKHEALDFLRDVTEKMGLHLNFKARAGEDIVYIEMDGKDAGTVIGKRGQTLDSIQYLTSLVVNRDSEKYIKVVIDAENYRAKRQKTLEQLAERLAAKVVRTGKYVRLEPMNPYERKIIHATLQHNPDINTRSEGEEPYRRVVIELKK